MQDGHGFQADAVQAQVGRGHQSAVGGNEPRGEMNVELALPSLGERHAKVEAVEHAVGVVQFLEDEQHLARGVFVAVRVDGGLEAGE
jgi:hypothetical protein